MQPTGQLLILGNWKMHLTQQAAGQLAATVAALKVERRVVVGVAPAFVHLPIVADMLIGSDIWLGAQTCHEQPEGAFTGDVGAPMLADMGCRFVIAGHSERRQFHHETSVQVRRKAEAAIKNGLHAVVCVGETPEQRESGTYLNVIEKQLRESLPIAGRDKLTVSYEPVWAIGTGKTATSADIEEVHRHIRTVLHDLTLRHAALGNAEVPRVLYGGSVKANNALDILTLPVVDGVLVGGASLDPSAFAAIIKAAEASASNRNKVM